MYYAEDANQILSHKKLQSRSDVIITRDSVNTIAFVLTFVWLALNSSYFIPTGLLGTRQTAGTAIQHRFREAQQAEAAAGKFIK